MRATEFLLEYDRSREQQRIESLPAYQTRLKQDPKFSLERLESADPTTQKIYVPRLVQWWLAGEPTEDLISTTADALSKYHTLKNKKLIKPEHTDVGRFKTADQFLSVLDQYELPGEKSPEDRGKYKEIHRDSEFLIVELLDETAAKWWGQGTKWCTAADRNNMFDYYFSQGPLYVIIHQKVKYQYWFEKDNPYVSQFMDAQDKEVDPTKLPFFTRLQPIMVKLSPHIMWNSKPSEQAQLAAVRKYWKSIRFIPNPSEEMQLAAVQQDGWAIEYIKNPSEEMQLAAVQQDGYSIQFITNPSEAVQLAAVRQYGYAIRHIRNPSEAVQLAAVRRNGLAIQWIPNPSEAVQLAAVKQDGFAIAYINNPSEAVQLAAVQQNARAIMYISAPAAKVFEILSSKVIDMWKDAQN
jgi:hypothetical protein